MNSETARASRVLDEPTIPPTSWRQFRMNRLLIVDDAMIMRKVIRDVAVQAGWQIVGEAGNGEQAIAMYAELKPDLVTMDLVMPVLGGLEALRRIREADPAARVIVVTALDQKQTLMDSIRLGAVDFVVKPFDRDRLVSLLNKFLRQAPAPEDAAHASPT